MDTKNVDRWSDDEVQALLSLFAEESIQQQLHGATRNDKVYACISARLGDLNIHRSSKQVREKLKKLKQDYKKIKDHNNRSGSDRKSGKWFERLDAVLGHHSYFSSSLEANDITLLEAIHDETETEESNEAEEDQEDIPDLSSLSAPMAKRPCQCCCQTYSEILSFLEKRSEAEQRLREDEFALRREEIEVQKSKIALERERLADERKERERRFELESQERHVILDLLKEKLSSGAGPSELLKTRRGLKTWTEFATNMAIAPTDWTLNSTADTVASETGCGIPKSPEWSQPQCVSAALPTSGRASDGSPSC